MPQQRLFLRRQDLADARLGPDPDATRALADGEVRLAVERFALTANNVTYAAFGEAMKYWQFFPAPDPALGCLPVWGFATVAESRAEGLAVGRRVWGCLPAGSHLVVQPARVPAAGFVDAAPHRAGLAPVYAQYAFCDADPSWRVEHEGLQAVLRPLFTTSFLLDDFLAGEAFFGARRLLLSSASSKTAIGTAFCMQQRPRAERPAIVGLTSPARHGFVAALGLYDEVCDYGELPRLDAAVPTLYVDFAGDAALREAVHRRFDGTLVYSCAIGGTHWQALAGGGGGGQGLPGPRPVLFFAPAQAQRRAAPPPEGWGRDGLQQRIGQ
ncbi:MAG: DUF2855 family protein, partial [Rubrivivax sp.]|nr:DUF2855 family protein [Rubrivivax sp.]